MVQQLAGVDQQNVGCRYAIDRDATGPRDTLDEHCFISFSQRHELVGERRRFVLEEICHLHVTLLTDDQQSGEYGLNVKDGHAVHDNNRLHPLHSLHFPLDFAVECARKQGGELLDLSAADVKRILDFYCC